MESLLCGVSADNEFGFLTSPNGNARPAFQHFHFWKCLEMFGALKWRNEERYLIFVAKLVAATAKPPQKEVKRENPSSVQTLSTASQKIQKYS